MFEDKLDFGEMDLFFGEVSLSSNHFEPPDRRLSRERFLLVLYLSPPPPFGGGR